MPISSPESIKSLSSFKGLPNRLEYLGKKDWIQIYNDSKATNFESSITGIKAVPCPSVLIAGGEKKDIDHARPVLQVLGNEINHVGGVCSGIKMKLINNYMSMVGMVMTAETIHFAKSLGIDQSKAVKILQGTAAGKGQININFPQKVLSGDITPDFPLKMGLKDISLAIQLGEENNLSLNLGRIS